MYAYNFIRCFSKILCRFSVISIKLGHFLIDSLQLGTIVMVSFFSTINSIEVRNIYLENHEESPRESFKISAFAKMIPYEIWHNLHPGKLINLNIFCKCLCIVVQFYLLFIFSCLQTLFWFS